MLIRTEHISNNGVLGIWKITETKEELLQLIPNSLQEKTYNHIHTLKSEKRVLEWLSTRLMLQQLLRNDEKIILHKQDGKPYLFDTSHNISISHTDKYAAILLHETEKVGIDIEVRSERVKKVAYKFIAETEFVDESQQTIHQLLHWSAKETLFKLMDETEIDFKEHLHIKPFIPTEKGIIAAYETKTDKHQEYTLQYEVHPEYVLTWAFCREQQ